MILTGRWASVNGGPPILTAIDPEETDALRGLAHRRTVLEIGSAYGYSAILMAKAGARVTTVDPHAGENPGSLERLQDNIDAYRFRNRIDPIVATSQYARPELKRSGRRFDLVFVDGDHSTAACWHDATVGWELLRPGGHLACHDYQEASCPGVTEALDGIWPGGPDGLVGSLWIKQKEATDEAV